MNSVNFILLSAVMRSFGQSEVMQRKEHTNEKSAYSYRSDVFDYVRPRRPAG
jgi:hypothetical protein